MDHTIAADRGDAGMRLDLVVRRHLASATAATRTQVQLWIDEGRVRVNDVVVTRAATRAMNGDIVIVSLPDAAARFVMDAEPVPLEVRYEDEALLILDKPAGIVVHPTYGHQTQTIMNGLLWRARDWPAGQRPSIVGRLDKQTSGLVVVAKRPDVHAALQRTLASAASTKDYLALVRGAVPAAPFDIALAIDRDPDDRRRVVARPDGLASLTKVERLASSGSGDDAVSLVRCRLMTGRMHQIRVHLATSGWPILGDAKYGVPFEGLARQALHAWRIAFAHPAGGRRIEVDAPPPADMAAVIAARVPGVASSL